MNINLDWDKSLEEKGVQLNFEIQNIKMLEKTLNDFKSSQFKQSVTEMLGLM